MSAPLEGIRVLDWTVYQQGPVATVMLGQLGAEVIKIEERQSGDLSRQVGGWMGLPSDLPGGRSFYFEAYNCNKKGITLDLTKKESREVVRRLVQSSDIFVHNLREEVARRLGVDYDTLRVCNTRLIYAQAWGYGHHGEDCNRPTIDQAVAARCGIIDSITPRGQSPNYPNLAMVDQMGATMLSYSILAALLARERLGVGQRVDSSLLGSALWLQAMHVNTHTLLDKDLSRSTRERAPNPLQNFYRCADGQWLFLGMLDSQRHWHDYCNAAGIQELEHDPRFATAPLRRENREELISILDRVFDSKTIEEWLRALSKYPDFIYAPVNSVHQALQDPQVMANGYLGQMDHPALGQVKLVALPFSMEKTPTVGSLPAPVLGEHTEQVLQEVCGYGSAEIASLREVGVI